MKKTSFFFLLVTVLYSSSCTDDAPVPSTPSPYVPTNKVTAVVNGQPWEDFAPVPYSSILAQYYPGNFFHLQAENFYGASYSSIYLKVYGLNDTGYYYLNDLNIGRYDTNNPVDKAYFTDSSLTGYLHVTDFDTAAQKITGEFEFMARDTVSGDTISISSGRIYRVSYIH